MTVEEYLSTHLDLFPSRRFCLQIGGLALGFVTHGMDVLIDSDQRAFVAKVAPEIEVDLDWADVIPPACGRKLFDSGASWELYENEEELLFDFVTPLLGPQPYKRLLMDKNFSRGKALFGRNYFAQGVPVRALEYPLDELIVTNWLARGRGIEVHGCGVTDDGSNNFLFIGHSGAGKSTTTRLWQALQSIRILSDDRIIIRKHETQFSMYGTPWHGEAGFASPAKAPLNQIFILEHGERNEIVPLSQSAAAAELFARCFLPFHDAQALSSTLAFLDDLTRNVACYKFQFLPDLSAVEKILEFHHSR
jgi:hypothetical protein